MTRPAKPGDAVPDVKHRGSANPATDETRTDLEQATSKISDLEAINAGLVKERERLAQLADLRAEKMGDQFQEILRLREALKPFGKAWPDAGDTTVNAHASAWESGLACCVTFGDFKAAFQALAPDHDHAGSVRVGEGSIKSARADLSRASSSPTPRQDGATTPQDNQP